MVKTAKVLFVSDIHLNLNKNRTWEENRFLTLAREIVCCKADIIILGGDTFDVPKPSLEELRAFYTFIEIINEGNPEVIVLSGNHEELSHHTTVFDYIPKVGFRYVEDETLTIGKHTLYLVSHHKIHGIKDKCLPNNSHLFSHIRCASSKHSAEISFSGLKFDNIILGDIHNITEFDAVKYAGQPYSTVYEVEQDRGFLICHIGLDFVTERVKTYLPSKKLLNTNFSLLQETILYGTNEFDLFKIRVTLTAEDASKLPKYTNIIYEPNVVETVVEDVENVKVNGRLEIKQTLLTLVADTYNLSAPVMEKGTHVLEGIQNAQC